MLFSRLLAAATGSAPFVQAAELLASDRATNDQFGYSVCLSQDGSTLAVGAPFEETSPNSNTGAVYTYTRSGSSWVFQQKIYPSATYNGAAFGASISLSDDGTKLVVGAPFDGPTVTDGGAAYVFNYSIALGWTQFQKITPAVLATRDYFGRSVCISGDGTTIIIGASGWSTPPSQFTYQGAAYIFAFSGPSWYEQQQILPSVVDNFGYFGYSVYLSQNGNTAIVGGYGYNSDEGKAFVFTRSGVSWSQQTNLIPSGSDANARYGYSVSLASDGNTAIVSAYQDDIGASTNAGSVFVWTRSGTTWTQRQELIASDYEQYSWFGFSCSISGDGLTIVIGASSDSISVAPTYSGSAYIFKRISGAGYTWNQTQKIKATPATANAEFGYSICISRNSKILSVGARLTDTSPLTDNGAAYVFT